MTNNPANLPSNVLATVCFSRYMNTCRTRSMGVLQFVQKRECLQGTRATPVRGAQTDVAHVWSSCCSRCSDSGSGSGWRR